MVKIENYSVNKASLMKEQLEAIDQIEKEQQQENQQRRDNITDRLMRWDLELPRKESMLFLNKTQCSTKLELEKNIRTGKFSIEYVPGLGVKSFKVICDNLGLDPNNN